MSAPIPSPDAEELREVYRLIAARAPGHEHGEFLTAFAEAFIRADYENFQLLCVPAVCLAVKYNLIPESPETK